MAAKGVAAVAIVLASLLTGTRAHVGLTFPPARKYDLDFLDNVRTRPPCGMPKGKHKHFWLNCLFPCSVVVTNITFAYVENKPHRHRFASMARKRACLFDLAKPKLTREKVADMAHVLADKYKETKCSCHIM